MLFDKILLINQFDSNDIRLLLLLDLLQCCVHKAFSRVFHLYNERMNCYSAVVPVGNYYKNT